MKIRIVCVLFFLLTGYCHAENFAKRKTLDLGNGIKMEFVLIPAGSFMIGSEPRDMSMPRHKVTITKPFYMGKYEVTQEQWEQVMGDNPSENKGEKDPVDRVNWAMCQDFLTNLNKTASSKGARLPTEAEWEYACRAGSTNRFCCADDEDEMGKYSWIDRNSGNTTHPVGKKKPNAWGLYDMHGNAFEWCADWFDKICNSEPEMDPVGPHEGLDRVIRGGSFQYRVWGCAIRGSENPGHGRNEHGLRVVLPIAAASNTISEL